MENTVVVEDECGSGFELDPVLAFWIGEDLVPLAERVVEALDIVGVNAQYGTVIVVVAHQNQFAGRIVVLQDRISALEQRTDHGVFISGRVRADAHARERLVRVWMHVFQHSCCKEPIDEQRFTAAWTACG